jgi:hypothetical protein
LTGSGIAWPINIKEVAEVRAVTVTTLCIEESIPVVHQPDAESNAAPGFAG